MVLQLLRSDHRSRFWKIWYPLSVGYLLWVFWEKIYRFIGDVIKRDGVSNHRRLHCLLKRLFRRRSKKTSKLRVTGLCEGNPLMTGGFPSQRASNAEISIWWRHHVITGLHGITDINIYPFLRTYIWSDILYKQVPRTRLLVVLQIFIKVPFLSCGTIFSEPVYFGKFSGWPWCHHLWPC